MKKVLGLVAAVGMLVAIIAGPAAAHDIDAGVFTGTANVSQGDTVCGAGSPGLGFPVVTPQKNGSYRLNTPTFVSVQHLASDGIGSLDICGDLTSVAGIGASCGMSKGYNGDGFIFDADGNVLNTVSDATWKLSAGGTLPVLGAVSGDTNGGLLAIVQAQGGAGCPTKSATEFTVVGAWVAGENIPSSYNPVTDEVDPKNDGPSSTNPLNIWGDKK